MAVGNGMRLPVGMAEVFPAGCHLVPDSGVALESCRDRTPLLTICATRPGLLVTLTLPERIEPRHVTFARQLAVFAGRYAAEVERHWRGLAPAPLCAGVAS